jgi:DNA-binding NarL/FixJ family response regulator
MDLDCIVILQDRMLRELIARYIESSRITVKCCVDSGPEALSALTVYSPALIIIGPPVHEMIVRSIADKLNSNHPQARVLLLASEHTSVSWPKQHKNQLIDILSYQERPEAIINSIAANFQISKPSSSYKTTVLDELSAREREILNFIGLALTSKDIANQLYISERTVETHRRNICRKLGVRGVSLMRLAALLSQQEENKP